MLPDHITVFAESFSFDATGSQIASFSNRDIKCTCTAQNDGITISCTADSTPVRFLRARWLRKAPAGAVYCGDSWERLYGDAQWRTIDPARRMPWFFMEKSDNKLSCFGVRVRPNAFALWNVDPEGITLFLDLRCGTQGVVLRNRTVDAATVVMADFENTDTFDGAQRFCRMMCSDPLLPSEPVYGSNNWYYAYGISSHREILADTAILAGMTAGISNRPFMVIDDGWQVCHDPAGMNGGPWHSGNERFPDMALLAKEMKNAGVRPGIWFRPLWNTDPEIPAEWLLKREGSVYLDPSRKEVLDLVAKDTARLTKEWGFELVKHDFTTFDIFGRWGFLMNAFPADGNWRFFDDSKTSAEIVKELYRTITNAAGGAYIIGCNTIGHLAAGLIHISRIGDDTSGLRWERTRKMGINCLAFRMPQHRVFFDIDADCAGITGAIEWKYNRQWSDLLSRSGTTYFASVKPGVLDEKESAELREHFANASRQRDFTAIPGDWIATTAPEHWIINGQNTHYNWYPEAGAEEDFLYF